MGGNQGAMGPMGMNPWMNPNMSEKEREKMMKANPWGQMGGPWGGMGCPMGQMGPMGGMGGPWGQMGMNPWMNPNMSEKEREKMMKANPWGQMGGPWGQMGGPMGQMGPMGPMGQMGMNHWMNP